jgi:hypothetical protein
MPKHFEDRSELDGFVPAVRQPVEVVTAAHRDHLRHHEDLALSMAVRFEPQRKGPLLLHSARVIFRHNRPRFGKPFWNVYAGVENDITPRIECPGPHNVFRFQGELAEDFGVRKGHELGPEEDPIHLFFQARIVLSHFVGVADFFSDEISADGG